MAQTTADEIFAAAKTNDCEKLISLLSQKNLPWSPQSRKPIVDDLSALETAFQHGSNEAANILACYEALGRDYIENKRPHEIVATKSVWCRCLSNAVLSMKNSKTSYTQHIRGLSTNKDNFYSHPDWRLKGEKRPFYYIVRDHYSKLLTPFEAIERPAAFMALMRLDDNFKILSPEGYTLPMHILVSNGVIKNHKLAMLKFIEHFDKEIFLVPSGPIGLIPAVYCLATNNVSLFNCSVWVEDMWKFRSTTERNIMDYCLNKHLEFFSAETRTKIYTQVDGALNTFLIRNIKGKKKQRFYDKVALDALETMLKSGKQDQLRELAALVNDRALGAFMVQAGYTFEELMKYACNTSVSSEQKYFHSESQGTFDFVSLPLEMLELIMAALTARDILNLFVVNKSMRELFKQFDSNALWRQILRNSKLTLDGDVPMPANDLKKYVLTTERTKGNWQSGKFKQKTLIQLGDYTKEVKMDDNWLWATSSRNCAHFVNMHTDEQLSLQLTDGSLYLSGSTCLVESPPFDPPLMALFSSQRNLYYGRPGSSSKGYLHLPTPGFSHPITYAQSKDRVVVSSNLQVVDLNTQCKVAQIPEGVAPQSVAFANPFNRSMSIGGTFTSLSIFDRDMQVVQTMKATYNLQAISMIDEYTHISHIYGTGLVLFDIRNLQPESYQVLLQTGEVQHAIDVRNQRMLVSSGPYNLISQINLRTRQWERLWKPFNERSFPIINDKYIVMTHSRGLNKTEIVAQDLSV